MPAVTSESGQIDRQAHGSQSVGGRIIAEAWLTVSSASTTEGRSYTARSNDRSILTSPGRWVQFRAGHAIIRDPRDLVAVLRLEGATVQVSPDYVEWLPALLNEHCGESNPIRAEMRLPSGFAIDGGPGQYQLVRVPIDDAEPAAAEPSPVQASANAVEDDDPDEVDLPGAHQHRPGCTCKMCEAVRAQARRSWRPQDLIRRRDAQPEG